MFEDDLPALSDVLSSSDLSMFHDEGTSSSSSANDIFQPDALIWAKMKGFPPWPAKVLPQSEDTPMGRIPVMFFGTKETAFMKASDCSDYMSNKHQYEVPRKHKGFNDGVHEIRVEAGIESAAYMDPVFFPPQETTTSFSSTSEASGRIRRTSARFNDSLLSDFVRKRSNSGSTKTRSRASSTPSTLKFLHKHLNKRRRLDSESSNGSRRRQMMISGGLSAGLGNDPLNGLFDLALEESQWNMHETDNLLNISDDARSTRSRRSRGHSKVFEDYVLGMDGSPARNRHRSNSHSDGKRSRLISGVSDIFDELFNGAGDLHAVAADFINTLDEMPSESSEIFPHLMERDGTPEAPAPLPRPVEFCNSCGGECKLIRGKYRCDSKFCKAYHARLPLNEDMPGTSDSSDHPMNLDLNTMMVKEETTESSSDGMKVVKKERAVTTNKFASVIPKKEKEEKKKKPMKTKIKLENDSPIKKKSARDRIREDFEKNDKHLASSVKKEKKKVQVVSPRQYSLSPPTSPTMKSPDRSREDDSPTKDKRTQGRPKQYKVEKTPPVKNGLRHCSFCNGQVRPQMCGGNKHRWRCVDKKCRKWYGWVKSSDEIPMDLGRKGRHNSVLGKIKLKKKEKPRIRQMTEKTDVGSISSAGEAALAAAHLDSASLKSGDTGRASSPRLLTLAEMRRNKAAAESLLRMRASRQVVPQPVAPPPAKKKKTVPKPAVVPKIEEEPPKRAVSPLTQREARYRPCGMEKRARWWLSEKRRADPSPERELQTGMADAAAAFRVLSHAFRAAAVTRADEIGTVNGALDLMMDSLLGCMGPLLSLMSKLPNAQPGQEVVQQLWDASAVHIPIFQ